MNPTPATNAAKTHCKRGHALIPGNLYVRPSRPFARICLTCKRVEIWASPVARRAAGLAPITREDAEREVLAYWPDMAYAARTPVRHPFRITPENVEYVRDAGRYIATDGSSLLLPEWARKARDGAK